MARERRSIVILAIMGVALFMAREFTAGAIVIGASGIMSAMLTCLKEQSDA